ncbi:MAG: RluA family pseudouridine synthase [Clostridia bacterium]|nr:RluA family pseudouridine synthase [Clostridia bacterium]
METNDFITETAAEECETLSLTADESGVRLDAFVAAKAEISRSQAQKWIEDGAVTVNGKEAAKNCKLKAGDAVEITLPENEDCEAVPENIPLDVRYEDDDIIIVNKPCGMVVHPAPGHTRGTLVNALLYHCGDSLSGIGGVSRPGIVHRIDRDTSGLICAAKNDKAHLSLAAQLADHSMHREYRLIAVGGLKDDTGTIDAPIGRHPTDRKKMAVIRQADKKARHAVTHYSVLERFSGFTYAQAVLETGRTHQIRVHMAYIGHPLMGDTVYGGGHTPFEKHNAPLLDGQMLHAAALILAHPVTGEKMRFETPMPDNFTAVLEKLRRMES